MTENDLYAMGMESQTAWAKMEELCKAFGIQYPPNTQKNRQSASLLKSLFFKGN